VCYSAASVLFSQLGVPKLGTKHACANSPCIQFVKLASERVTDCSCTWKGRRRKTSPWRVPASPLTSTTLLQRSSRRARVLVSQEEEKLKGRSHTHLARRKLARTGCRVGPRPWSKAAGVGSRTRRTYLAAWPPRCSLASSLLRSCWGAGCRVLVSRWIFYGTLKGVIRY
jgi:hypothetical protein